MTRRRLELGAGGENHAAAYLKKQGYQIIESNWRCRLGEIDLIAKKGCVLAVCEVKTRTTDTFGHPLEAITPRKQARLRRLGEFYLSFVAGPDLTLRFDAIGVTAGPGGVEIDHIEGAF